MPLIIVCAFERRAQLPFSYIFRCIKILNWFKQLMNTNLVRLANLIDFFNLNEHVKFSSRMAIRCATARLKFSAWTDRAFSDWIPFHSLGVTILMLETTAAKSIPQQAALIATHAANLNYSLEMRPIFIQILWIFKWFLVLKPSTSSFRLEEGSYSELFRAIPPLSCWPMRIMLIE